MYLRLKSQNLRPLKRFVFDLAGTLMLFSDYLVIHSDLKPDNILVKVNENSREIEELKLIDFGSSFSYNETGTIAMATPEYMPPELLELISNGNKPGITTRSQIEYLAEIGQPWSIDVWSLGAIILEIIIGECEWK